MKENITVESVEKLGKRNARTSRKPAANQSIELFHMEQLTREQIEIRFQIFGTVIPASSAETTRRRTSYFYRQEAIAWARMARIPIWQELGASATAERLAKRYLAEYRQMKGAN